jgi:hypothetical protein
VVSHRSAYFLERIEFIRGVRRGVSTGNFKRHLVIHQSHFPSLNPKFLPATCNVIESRLFWFELINPRGHSQVKTENHIFGNVDISFLLILITAPALSIRSEKRSIALALATKLNYPYLIASPDFWLQTIQLGQSVSARGLPPREHVGNDSTISSFRHVHLSSSLFSLGQ